MTFHLQLGTITVSEKLAQQVVDTLWAAGVRPTGYVEPSKPAGIIINGRPASDYMSQSLIPEGFYTVVSYLARHNPEALALICDLATDTQRDGFWLAHQARKRGLRSIKVLAPKVLQEQGIQHVNAYPVELLQRRFDD